MQRDEAKRCRPVREPAFDRGGAGGSPVVRRFGGDSRRTSGMHRHCHVAPLRAAALGGPHPPGRRRWLPTAFLGCLSLVTILGCGDPGTTLGGDALEDTPWAPAIPDAGEVGWRDATDPWRVEDAVTNCIQGGDTQFDLWVDEVGLWSLWTWTEFATTSGMDPRDRTRTRLDLNEGEGWSGVYDASCGREPPPDWDARCLSALVGRLGSALVGVAWGISLTRTPLVSLEGGTTRAWSDDALGLVSPTFVREDLAYAILPGTDVKVVRWRGTAWEPLPAVLPYREVTQLWADENEVWVAGTRGTVLSLEGASWRVHAVPGLTDAAALFGFSGTDVWVSGRAGELLHWDGATWTGVPWEVAETAGSPCAYPDWIYGMWGRDGMLFLHTGNAILRWSGGRLSVLGAWPPERDASGACVGGVLLLRVRGLSPNEVFFAAMEPQATDRPFDPAADQPLCVNRPFVLRWDGAAFHWM